MREASDLTGLFGPLDRALVELVARQHGVFAIWQAHGIGLTENAVQKRYRAGRLHRVHRGVYALTPRSLLSREGRWLAAVLACGPAAALSHRSRSPSARAAATGRHGVDVIVPGGGERRYPGIDAHRSKHLTAADLSIVSSIPVTTIARTMLDLAAVVDQRAVERVIEEASIGRCSTCGRSTTSSSATPSIPEYPSAGGPRPRPCRPDRLRARGAVASRSGGRPGYPVRRRASTSTRAMAGR